MSTPDSDRCDPLTLQEQSFLFVVLHVHQYPPTLLSLLPRRWRESLLRVIPLCHLVCLDQTKVADGIETSTIWKESCSLLRCDWVSYALMDSLKHSRRDCFISYICNLIINQSYQP